MASLPRQIAYPCSPRYHTKTFHNLRDEANISRLNPIYDPQDDNGYDDNSVNITCTGNSFLSVANNSCSITSSTAESSQSSSSNPTFGRVDDSYSDMRLSIENRSEISTNTDCSTIENHRIPPETQDREFVPKRNRNNVTSVNPALTHGGVLSSSLEANIFPEREIRIPPYVNEHNLKIKSKCLKRLPIFIAILVSLAIAAIVTVVELNNNGILSGDYLSTVELTARVDDEFQTNMTNTSSSEFVAYETKFCSSINQTLQDQAIMPNCAVNKLSNGSVVVYSTVTLITNASNLQDSLTSWLQGNSNDSHVSWGNLTVFTREINISVTKTIKYQKPDTAVQTTSVVTTIEPFTTTPFNKLSTTISMRSNDTNRPDNYDCSKVTEPTFLPLSNTYPHNCSAFQLCSNGKVLQLHCGPGLEFSDVTSSNDVVCDRPSNRTYCGMRRSAITPSSNTSAATTVMVTENTNFPSTAPPSFLTGSTVTFSNEHTSTAETTSVDFCQQLDIIFSSLTSECTGAEDYFIPQLDTYPDNCRNFIWCTKVNTSFNISCPNGTVFKVQEYIKGSPCVHESDNDSYCKVRSRYENCP